VGPAIDVLWRVHNEPPILAPSTTLI
jgi:hypothetical protein